MPYASNFGGHPYFDCTRTGKLLVGRLFSWVAQIARFDLALHPECGTPRRAHAVYGLYAFA